MPTAWSWVSEVFESVVSCVSVGHGICYSFGLVGLGRLLLRVLCTHSVALSNAVLLVLRRVAFRLLALFFSAFDDILPDVCQRAGRAASMHRARWLKRVILPLLSLATLLASNGGIQERFVGNLA